MHKRTAVPPIEGVFSLAVFGGISLEAVNSCAALADVGMHHVDGDSSALVSLLIQGPDYATLVRAQSVTAVDPDGRKPLNWGH